MIHRDDRPWGWFEILYEEKNLKVKRILVNPNNRLSLQSHKHRSENWAIITGNAQVHLDDKIIFLSPNQTIFIPQECKHRVENQEDSDLIFVEIQTGSYLGEDDIIRYEDDYNRA